MTSHPFGYYGHRSPLTIHDDKNPGLLAAAEGFAALPNASGKAPSNRSTLFIQRIAHERIIAHDPSTTQRALIRPNFINLSAEEKSQVLLFFRQFPGTISPSIQACKNSNCADDLYLELCRRLSGADQVELIVDHSGRPFNLPISVACMLRSSSHLSLHGFHLSDLAVQALFSEGTQVRSLNLGTCSPIKISSVLTPSNQLNFLSLRQTNLQPSPNLTSYGDRLCILNLADLQIPPSDELAIIEQLSYLPISCAIMLTPSLHSALGGPLKDRGFNVL